METIALIAHDKKKEEMLDFASHHKDLLSHFHLVATRTTGTLLKEKLGLEVETMMSGPLGGDQQIGALVATEQVLCDVHNIPLATNRKSGHILLQYADKKLKE